MYFDNLTIAGILITAPYTLLPLLFRREILRVREDLSNAGNPSVESSDQRTQQVTTCGHPEPCH